MFILATVVLLHKKRKHIEQEDSAVYDSVEVDIETLIDQRMKKYSKSDIVIELDPEKVNMLLDMGFTEGRVRRALTLCYSDTEEALNWLLMHTDDEDADLPLTQREVRKFLGFHLWATYALYYSSVK